MHDIIDAFNRLPCWWAKVDPEADDTIIIHCSSDRILAWHDITDADVAHHMRGEAPIPPANAPPILAVLARATGTPPPLRLRQRLPCSPWRTLAQRIERHPGWKTVWYGGETGISITCDGPARILNVHPRLPPAAPDIRSYPLWTWVDALPVATRLADALDVDDRAAEPAAWRLSAVPRGTPDPIVRLHAIMGWFAKPTDDGCIDVACASDDSLCWVDGGLGVADCWQVRHGDALRLSVADAHALADRLDAVLWRDVLDA